MNFNALSNQAMLSHSDEWLNTPEIRAMLVTYPLTKALLSELQGAHDELAEKQGKRASIFSTLGQLTDGLVVRDQVHDRKARGMHSILSGLAECADDADTAAQFHDLLGRLFPYGLSVVNRSYIDEAGAVVEMESRITDADVAFMESVQVGDQSLADVYGDWVEAGQALGREARERARLQRAITREGTAAAEIDTRGARQRWIRTADTLVSILDVLAIPDEERERLLAPMEKSIADAARSRGGADEDSDEVPGDGIADGGGGDLDLDDDLDAATGDALDGVEEALLIPAESEAAPGEVRVGDAVP